MVVLPSSNISLFREFLVYAGLYVSQVNWKPYQFGSHIYAKGSSICFHIDTYSYYYCVPGVTKNVSQIHDFPDVLFILHAEHEMNCSTADVRHLASR